MATPEMVESAKAILNYLMQSLETEQVLVKQEEALDILRDANEHLEIQLKEANTRLEEAQGAVRDWEQKYRKVKEELAEKEAPKKNKEESNADDAT